MKIWLIKIGETLPIDAKCPRLLRMGILADMLAQKGHNVTWWTSTFDHQNRKHRSEADKVIDIHNKYQIRMLHSLAYKKSVSIQRILNHKLLARKFKKQCITLTKPDVILCSMPSIELAYQAVKFGTKNNLPVVLDLRDMWPDIFLREVPHYLRRVSRFCLSHEFLSLKRACRNAAALFGVTSKFLEWGLNYAGRPRQKSDGVFFLSPPPSTTPTEDIEAAESFWKGLGIHKDTHEFIISFVGTLGKQFDLASIINVVKKSRNQIKLVIAGDGDNIKYYQNLAQQCTDIIFSGWIDHPKIVTLLQLSNMGLAPYRNTIDFMSHIPNKVIEYLGAGLPILTPLKGEVSDLIKKYSVGFFYDGTNNNELADLLDSLISDDRTLTTQKVNALKLYEESFHPEKVYNQMIHKLEEIANT